MDIKTFVFILIFTTLQIDYNNAAVKNPLRDPFICGRPQCEPSSNKFKFAVGNIYKYDYSMYVKTLFSGSGENSSELHMVASVGISFYSACEGVLNLDKIELREEALETPAVAVEDEYADYPEVENDAPKSKLHPKSGVISEELMKHNLKFSFEDGLIGEVCPNVNEPIWVLNLKKGILSSFQNTMPRFDIDYNTTETDVSGTCDVNYVLVGAKKTSLLIQKTKDLPGCRDRYKTHSALQTTPYDFRQKHAAWPILNSESFCNISIDNFLYNNVVCFERHQLVPFSNQKSGAVTESYTKLAYVDSYGHGPINSEPIERRSPLLYDHTPSVRQSHTEIKVSRELLKQMCKTGFPDIQRNFPDIFLNFLSTARMLSFNALQQLLLRSSSICARGKNHVIESLPYIGSSASVLLMKDQIVKKLVSADVASSWVESLSYFPRPNEEVLEAMYHLIEYGKNIDNHDYILSASAVTHTFCAQNPNCIKTERVKMIVNYLENDLAKNLKVQPHTNKLNEKIMINLKALGNIGVISKKFEDLLKNLIVNESRLMEIRLQAIHAYRRFDCTKKKEYFLRLFSNFKENSEIRIASYLQSMKCPDYLSIKAIKNVLKTEEVNQVGSFVWSHLTNLAKSASPVRVETQGLLVDEDLGRKFKMDIRKFSRNYEHSIFFDEYNFGATSDGNVIFGTNSYFPRTASFNLTVDLFGESVNLFELNTRTEGFEHYIESIFGPKGPFNTERFKEKFSFITKFLRDTNNMEDDQVNFDRINVKTKRDNRYLLEGDSGDKGQSRIKRDTRNNGSMQMEDKVDKIGYKLNYNFNRPEASIGMKIFGNDLKYYTLSGADELQNAVQKLNIISYLQTFLAGQEITFSKSGVFLDTSYEVPLTSGLPLAVSILGASSLNMNMSGTLNSLDLKSIETEVQGRIKSSISMDIIGTMKSDFMHAATGIKVKSNLFSNSALEAKLKIRGARFGSLQFSLPQEHNEILSVRSELLVVRSNNEIKQKGIKQRYSNSTCTWPVIDQAIGLKMCASYSLPDVSNSKTPVPSLILSGPVKLDINLDKADPTAKIFLFKYYTEDVKNISSGTFIFETPGSKIPRIFTTTVTNDRDGYNVSMGFKNGFTVHSAVGIYKDTTDAKQLDISLNVDEKKYLSLEMGVNRTDLKYGSMYYPSLFLSVNNERIAGLAGTLKVTAKKSISQYDANLQFETKRLLTKLKGYVIKTDALSSVKMTMDYRFYEGKQETLNFETELANKSNKGRTEYQGNMKLKSSAYPHLNFASNMNFQSSLGHVECKVDYNNAPDLKDPKYATTLRLTFARSHVAENGRTTASIEITRPKTRTDYKVMVKHEEKFKNGPEHNILFLFRYAPQRDVTAVFSVHLPKGALFTIDSAMNITVPSFDSCTLNFKVKEKSRKEYNLDINGVWFSGHSIVLKGLYQDRSSAIKTYQHIKFIAQSPSFEELTVDLKYLRDEYEFKFEIIGDYAKEPYGITIRNVRESVHESSTYAELKWRDKMYWFSANMKTNQSKQLFLEIHIDKIRDINIILRGLSTEEKREVGFEIKWDANRDPTQKLAISAEFNTPKYRSYNGGFLVTYPDRTFSGSFNLIATAPDYVGNARIAWSATEAFELKLNAGSNLDNFRNMWFSAKLGTPFEGWRHNAIKGGFYYLDNIVKCNGSAYWAENQQIGFDMMGLYRVQDSELNLELDTKVFSTIVNVPTVKLYMKHKHNDKRMDTEFLVNHTLTNDNQQLVSIRSGWQFDNSKSSRNIAGSLVMKSPFESYTRGSLAAKFSLSESRQLTGAANLDLEDRNYAVAVEGHIRKLIDNMLVLNITTPLEKFRHVVARFGINDKEKHIVAEVRAAAGALGVEVLFSVISSSDFDIKFNLATPLEAFSKVVLIGKLKPNTIEFRGGWNKVVLGFVGMWRRVSMKNFEYSYRIYTPLEKFEDNGVVLKYVQNEFVDMELSLKLAQYKLGTKIVTKAKSKLLRQAGIQRTSDILDNFLPDELFNLPANDAAKEEEEEEEGDLLNFLGYIEVDTIVWPTVKGDIDVEEIGDTYLASGQLVLPQGNIEIRDRFYYPDMLNMKNVLKVTTPFVAVKEIKSDYECMLDFGVQYVIGLHVLVLNHEELIKTGYRVNYTTSIAEADLKTHEVSIDLITPLENLRKIALQGFIELEESNYRGNITAKTLTTDISMSGSYESKDNFTDTSLSLWLHTPLFPYYACRAFYKRDASEVENTLDAGFEINENYTLSNFRVDGVWHNINHFISGKGKVQSNFMPLRTIESSVLVTKTPHPIALFEINYVDSFGGSEEIKARALKNREIVTVEISLPLPDYKNVSAYGTVKKTSVNDEYTITGNLYRNSEAFKVDGTAKIVEDIPKAIELNIKPVEGGDKALFSYSVLDNHAGDGVIVEAKISQNAKYAAFSGNFDVHNKLDWNVNATVSTSDSESPMLVTNAGIHPAGKNRYTGKFGLTTPWTQYGIDDIEIEGNVGLMPKTGNLNTKYRLNKVTGESRCAWTWVLMEDMQITLQNSVKRESYEKYFKTGLRYINSRRNMHKLIIGGDLNVDRSWIFSTNGTLSFISMNDIGATVVVRLPEPIRDVHKLSGKYRGNIRSNDPNLDIGLEASYETEESKRKYAWRTHYRNVSDLQGFGRFEWGQNSKSDAVETNIQILRKGTKKELSARLATPYYQEDTIQAKGTYDVNDVYQVVSAVVHMPASVQVADANIAYQSLSNMKGSVNTTTPFPNITWLRGDFDFTTTGQESIRYLKASWPGSTAVIDAKNSFVLNNLDRDQHGTIKVELPLQTRHYTLIKYGLKEWPSITTGYTDIEYNSKNILNGHYSSKAEKK